MKKLSATFFMFILVSFSVFAQETFTLTTYYPAPFGVYTELRAKRAAVGENYFNNSTYPWDTDSNITGNEISEHADLVVQDRVGIGTIIPEGPLHVDSPANQGYIIASGVSDEGHTYSALYLAGDENTFLDNTWFIAHKKETDNVMKDDLHIGYYDSSKAVGITIDQPTSNVGIKNTNPQAALDVAGGVKIGKAGNCNNSSAGCNADNTGTIRHCNNTIEACLSSGGGSYAWQPIGGSGESKKMCKAIYMNVNGFCGGVITNSWQDQIHVPVSWTVQDCINQFTTYQWGRNPAYNNGRVWIGCKQPNGAYSEALVFSDDVCGGASSTNRPSPNCGW